MTLKKISYLIVLCAFTTLTWANPIDDITFITENYPPYNFKDKENVKGIAPDILVLLFEKVGSKKTRKNIKVLPWARGYRYVQEVENTALFSTVRTQKRENLFKWVGPIATSTNSLIALKKNNIKIESINDLNEYKIGVVRDDIGEQLLLQLGIKPRQIESTGGVDAIYKLIKMLNRNRFDIWSYEQSVAQWELKKNDYALNKYEVIYKLKTSELYFAFHKNTPEEVINQLQNALDELKKEGKYQLILDKYLKM